MIFVDPMDLSTNYAHGLCSLMLIEVSMYLFSIILIPQNTRDGRSDQIKITCLKGLESIPIP